MLISPQVEAKLALVKEEMSQLSKEHREVRTLIFHGIFVCQVLA